MKRLPKGQNISFPNVVRSLEQKSNSLPGPLPPLSLRWRIELTAFGYFVGEGSKIGIFLSTEETKEKVLL